MTVQLSDWWTGRRMGVSSFNRHMPSDRSWSDRTQISKRPDHGLPALTLMMPAFLPAQLARMKRDLWFIQGLQGHATRLRYYRCAYAELQTVELDVGPRIKKCLERFASTVSSDGILSLRNTCVTHISCDYSLVPNGEWQRSIILFMKVNNQH